MSATAVHHKSVHHDPQSAAIAVAQDEARHAEALKRERQFSDRLWLTGRFALGGAFAAAGLIKVFQFDQTRTLLESHERAAPTTLVMLAIAVEVFGGALLAAGWYARRTAFALISWLVVVTAFMHWDVSDPTNRTAALANLAIIAGLMMVAARGAGPQSVDAAKVREQLRAEMA